MVQMLQYLHLLKGPKERKLLRDSFYFANAFDPAVAFEDLPNDCVASGEHF